MFAKIKELREERESGFTLIELLVVILIIGILAAIAIPLFLNQRKSAVDSATKSDVKNLTTQIETWMVKNPSLAITGTGSYYNQADLIALASDATQKVYPSVKLSAGTLIKVSGTTNIGEYKICAYNPAGSEGTNFNNAISYDSTTGKLASSVTSGC